MSLFFSRTVMIVIGLSSKAETPVFLDFFCFRNVPHCQFKEIYVLKMRLIKFSKLSLLNIQMNASASETEAAGSMLEREGKGSD